MPRYGDLDALKDSFKESYEKLNELYDEAPSEGFKEIIRSQMIVFLEAILRTGEAPTADVVEVVRCEDCKYCNIGETEDEAWCECSLFNIGGVADFYCKAGERRDDG